MTRQIKELKTLPYMTQFRCVGGSCPDSCCIGWEIWIEEPQYLALRERLSCSEDDRALFDRGLVVPDQPTGNAQEFARFRLRDDGRCTFLDDDGLCAIERRFGAAALGAVCRMHPRRIQKRGERMELTATLSCPEAARLCLAQSNPAPLVRPLPSSGIAAGDGPDPTDVYRAAETLVRDAALALLTDESIAVADRLLRTADLALRLEPVYGRAKREPIERIREVLAGSLTTPASWDGEYAFVRTVVAASRALPQRTAWNALLDVAASLGEAEFRARRRDADLIGRHHVNYAVNYWLHESFIDSPSVLPYALALLGRIALHRYLVLGHPGSADRLEDVSVTIAAALTRELEHVPALRTAFENAIADCAAAIRA